MIKFNEIKVGDYLIADNDGDKKQGEVTRSECQRKTGLREYRRTGFLV
jgi:hypothetical protein